MILYSYSERYYNFTMRKYSKLHLKIYWFIVCNDSSNNGYYYYQPKINHIFKGHNLYLSLFVFIGLIDSDMPSESNRAIFIINGITEFIGLSKNQMIWVENK